MEKKYKILIVEDEEAHAELVLRAFNAQDECVCFVAKNKYQAICLIEKNKFDLILTDWKLPDGNGSDFLSNECISKRSPIIVMTSFGSEELAVEAMKLGAFDYVVKSGQSFKALPLKAKQAIKQWEDEENRKKSDKLKNYLFEIAEISLSGKNVDEICACALKGFKNIAPADYMLSALRNQNDDFEEMYSNYPCSCSNERRKTCFRYLEKHAFELDKPKIYDFEDILKSIPELNECPLNESSQWLFAPLEADKKKIGSLIVCSIDSAVKFRDEDAEAIEFLSSHLASAVQKKNYEEALIKANAELKQFISQKSAELDATSDELVKAQEKMSELIELFKESEDRFIALADIAPTFIWMADEKGNIVYINKYAKQLIGANDGDSIILDFFSYVIPEDRSALKDYYKELIASKGVIEKEIRIRNNSSGYSDVLLAATARREKTGKLIGIIGAAADVTNFNYSRAAMQKTIEKEKALNELKSKFVSLLSIQWKKPLKSIVNASVIVEKSIETKNENNAQKYLDLIFTRAKYLSSLIDNAIIFANPNLFELIGEAKEFDVKIQTEEIIDAIKEDDDKNRINVRFSGASSVKMSQKAFVSVASRLLDNAIKYSPRYSTIEIKIDNDDYNLIFSIGDKGVGIMKEDLEKIFEPFHRGKNAEMVQGVGLGLCICKRIAVTIGASIVIESEPNIGTVVVFNAPLL